LAAPAVQYPEEPTGCDFATSIVGARSEVNTYLQPVVYNGRKNPRLGQAWLSEEWSLSELEEKAGVSKAYISDIENAAAGRPNIQYVYALAVALGVTLDELLDETGGPWALVGEEKVQSSRQAWRSYSVSLI
jgi:hypothetical protein